MTFFVLKVKYQYYFKGAIFVPQTIKSNNYEMQIKFND